MTQLCWENGGEEDAQTRVCVCVLEAEYQVTEIWNLMFYEGMPLSNFLMQVKTNKFQQGI